MFGPAQNEKGAAPLLLAAVLGILLFIFLSSSLPFKDNLFSNIFPKIPSFAAHADSRGHGLTGTYFKGRSLTGTSQTRIDSTINFDWGWGGPDPNIGSDLFSIRWNGIVVVPKTGSYTFYLQGNDGVRLLVNNRLLINAWKDQGPTEYSGTIELAAGSEYPIQIEYYEAYWTASVKFFWSGPDLPKQIVPSQYLIATADIPMPSSSPHASPHVSPSPTTPPVTSNTFPAINPLSLGTCSADIHDKYFVMGPDGNKYRTWHPVTDLETGCIFAHEHGDMLPEGAPKPAFGYASAKMGMFSELVAHPGFKIFSHSPGNINGFGTTEAKYVGPYDEKYYFVIHQGSAGKARLTEKHHSVEFWSLDRQNRETRIFAMADTGELGSTCQNTNAGRKLTCHDVNLFENWKFTINVGNAWRASPLAGVIYPMNHIHGTSPCADAECSNLTLVSSSDDICGPFGINCQGWGNMLPFGHQDSIWVGNQRSLHAIDWNWNNVGGAETFCTNPLGIKQSCDLPNSITQKVAAYSFHNFYLGELSRTDNVPGWEATVGLKIKGAPGGN